VYDSKRGRRNSNYKDYCDFIRLAHYCNAIHMIGNQVCAPIDLPANSRHLDTPRVTIVIASIEPRTLGAAMKEISGEIRTNNE
jgi:trimethylamine--corrinoid protein Co-methyltransferase